MPKHDHIRAMGKIKRRKSVRKEETIRVLASAEQKKIVCDAAERAGHSASSWLLALGLKAAAEAAS